MQKPRPNYRAFLEIEPEEWQEVHSPTESVQVRIDYKRTKEQGRRRKADSWLIESLTDPQLRAAQRIYNAYQSITRDGWIKVYPLLRMPGLSVADLADYEADLQHDYRRWSEEMARYNQPIALILDVLCHGKSFRDLAGGNGGRRAMKRRERFIDGLEAYVKMKGW